MLSRAILVTKIKVIEMETADLRGNESCKRKWPMAACLESLAM